MKTKEKTCNKHSNYLALTFFKNWRYYLFFTGTNEYIEIVQGGIFELDSNTNEEVELLNSYHLKSRHYINASENVQIVREDLVRKIGGLEKAIEISKTGGRILDKKKNERK